MVRTQRSTFQLAVQNLVAYPRRNHQDLCRTLRHPAISSATPSKEAPSTNTASQPPPGQRIERRKPEIPLHRRLQDREPPLPTTVGSRWRRKTAIYSIQHPTTLHSSASFTTGQQNTTRPAINLTTAFILWKGNVWNHLAGSQWSFEHSLDRLRRGGNNSPAQTPHLLADPQTLNRTSLLTTRRNEQFNKPSQTYRPSSTKPSQTYRLTSRPLEA